MNLGAHVGDDLTAVTANRARLAQALDFEPVFMNQVHGSGVVQLPLAPVDREPQPVTADACWTSVRGVACTVLVADCLPVLLARVDASAVAAVHAGWRGLLGVDGRGVIESALAELRASAPAVDVVAWLGPCIGPMCFEVGDEVRQAYMRAPPAISPVGDPGFPCDPGLAFLPHGPGKWLCDLPMLARQRLAAWGVRQVAGNDGSPAWCTVTHASRFFSHRRDASRLGSSGRLAACVWLR